MRIVHQIVDRCHVAESNLAVIRYMVSRMEKGIKTWRLLSKSDRKELMKIAIKRHNNNRELYNLVMSGK